MPDKNSYLLINRFNHFRHHFKINNKQDFAKIIGINNIPQYSRFESHNAQPDILTYWIAWQYLKKLDPNIHLEDLMEANPNRIEELLKRCPPK
jgi:hypothetical protein